MKLSPITSVAVNEQMSKNRRSVSFRGRPVFKDDKKSQSQHTGRVQVRLR